MVMSRVVAFTITPWLAYHMLKRRYNKSGDLLPTPLPGSALPPLFRVEEGHVFAPNVPQGV